MHGTAAFLILPGGTALFDCWLIPVLCNAAPKINYVYFVNH